MYKKSNRMGRTSVVLAVGDSINLVFVESEPFITIILASVVLNFINFYKKYNVFLIAFPFPSRGIKVPSLPFYHETSGSFKFLRANLVWYIRLFLLF